jgi:hypothetical protein
MTANKEKEKENFGKHPPHPPKLINRTNNKCHLQYAFHFLGKRIVCSSKACFTFLVEPKKYPTQLINHS